MCNLKAKNIFDFIILKLKINSIFINQLYYFYLIHPQITTGPTVI